MLVITYITVIIGISDKLSFVIIGIIDKLSLNFCNCWYW